MEAVTRWAQAMGESLRGPLAGDLRGREEVAALPPSGALASPGRKGIPDDAESLPCPSQEGGPRGR